MEAGGAKQTLEAAKAIKSRRMLSLCLSDIHSMMRNNRSTRRMHRAPQGTMEHETCAAAVHVRQRSPRSAGLTFEFAREIHQLQRPVNHEILSMGVRSTTWSVYTFTHIRAEDACLKVRWSNFAFVFEEKQ